MKHPKYAEDYAVCLRNLSILTTPGITHQNMLRLSRFDRKVVSDLAEQVQHKRVALTSSQYDLLKTLVKKYTKQLKKHGIDCADIDSAKLLFPLREIDKEQSVSISGEHLIVKFPYNPRFITELRTLKQGNGSFRFDSDSQRKFWKIALTEPHIEGIYKFAKAFGFEVSTELEECYQSLQLFRKVNSNYSIKLMQDGCITHAAPSLLEYLQQQGINNLWAKADRSMLCNYSVDNAVWETLMRDANQQFAEHYIRLAQEKHIVAAIDSVEAALTIALGYCELTKRTPLVIVSHETIHEELISKYSIKKLEHVDVNNYKNQIILVQDYHRHRMSQAFLTLINDPNSFVILNIDAPLMLYHKAWKIK